MSDKVVLAYSGGLDTSVAIKWLKEKYNLDVIAVTIDVGNEGDFSAVRQKALDAGAIKALVIDGKELFANYFIFPALQADAGLEVRIRVVDPDTGRLHITAAGADRLEVHTGQRSLPVTRAGQGFRVDVPRQKGDVLLLVRAFQQGQTVGFLARIARRAP